MRLRHCVTFFPVKKKATYCFLHTHLTIGRVAGFYLFSLSILQTFLLTNNQVIQEMSLFYFSLAKGGQKNKNEKQKTEMAFY